MKVSAWILLLLFVIISGPKLASAQSSFNGTDWMKWTREVKVMYLVGRTDGRQEGVYDAVTIFAPAVIRNWNTDPRLEPLFSKVTVGQLLAGMDAFYQDYRNLNIGIRTVVRVISDEASGRKHWTEGEVMNLRRIESSASSHLE